MKTGGVTLLLLFLMLCPWQQPVAADHRGGAASGALDTRYWRVCVYTPGSGGSAIQIALDRIAATHVQPTKTCSSLNVTYDALSYPDSWYGATHCAGSLSNGLCTSKYARLNLRTADTLQQRRKSALHELGHVGGLGHWFDNVSVMTQGASPPVSEYLYTHDVTALNLEYQGS